MHYKHQRVWNEQQHGQTEQTMFLCLNEVKARVMVCGVGQAFWQNEKEAAKKLAVCATVVVVFVINTIGLT
jgi:hypothetical protein